MLTRASLRALVLVGAAWLVHAAPASAWAQAPAGRTGDDAAPVRLTASLDGGYSRVHFEDYLASGVTSLAPMVRLDMPNAVVQARGSFARFESGNHNTQGSVAGGLFSPSVGGVRGELGGLVSLGYHESIGHSGTAQAIMRVHLGGQDMGAWGSVGAGWSALGGGIGEDVLFGDMGGWWRSGDLRMTGVVRFAGVDAVVYSDIDGAVRWARRRLELGLEGGVRSGVFESLERRTGTQVDAGAWAAGEAVFWLHDRLAIVAAAGRFLADPAANTIGGRYASLALRVANRPAMRAELPRVLIPRRAARPLAAADAATNGADGSAAAHAAGSNGATERLEIREAAGNALVLRLTLPGADSVELMGDFTDWEPLSLSRVAPGVWEIGLVLDAGVHRVNVRTNGGDWRVPPALTAVSDGFGGRVGLLVVGR